MVRTDIDRGKALAELLHEAFRTTGIHGRKDMPEDDLPAGVVRGSLEHILFLTLTVSIDYQRDANALWSNARRSFEDAGTRYLFDPHRLSDAPWRQVGADLQKYGLSKKAAKDCTIWRTGGITFHKKLNGDPRQFLADCGWDAPTVLGRLRSDTHLNFEKDAPDYPYLRGPKIGPLWLRMLRDNAGLKIECLDAVPIPVDVHVARATLAVGVVCGQYDGPMDEIYAEIRKAWHGSVAGLQTDGREMIALDLDEALWHLSKYGCTDRDLDTGDCPPLSDMRGKGLLRQGARLRCRARVLFWKPSHRCVSHGNR